MKLLSKRETAQKLCVSYNYLDCIRKMYEDFPKAMSFSKAQAGSKLFFDEDEIDKWLLVNKEKFQLNAAS